MNEIPSVFGAVKYIMTLVTILVTGGTIWVLYAVFASADEERNSIYVVDSHNTLKLALAEDVSVNRVYEAEAVVKRLHELLFILSPDADFINDRIDKAQYISGNSVRSYCNSQKERGFYNSLVANGISSEFLCDSISVLPDEQYDYRVTLWGKTSLVFSDKILFYSVVTSCTLVSCERSALDPQGFYVEEWQVVSQEELGAWERKSYLPEVAQDSASKESSLNKGVE